MTHTHELPPDALSHIMRDKRRWWSVADLAEALGLSQNHIYGLIGSCDLEAHSFGKRKEGHAPRDHGDLFPTARRSGTRITRRSVIAFLIASAEYDLTAEDLTTGIARVIRDLPDAAIQALARHCAETLALRKA